MVSWWACAECDKIYKMEEAGAGALAGNFSSPNFGPGTRYPADLQCIYTFIAKPGWRVKLTFAEFALAGTAPRSPLLPFALIGVGVWMALQLRRGLHGHLRGVGEPPCGPYAAGVLWALLRK